MKRTDRLRSEDARAQFVSEATERYKNYLGKCFRYRNKCVFVTDITIRGDQSLLLQGIVIKEYHPEENTLAIGFHIESADVVEVEKLEELQEITRTEFAEFYDERTLVNKTRLTQIIQNVDEALKVKGIVVNV